MTSKRTKYERDERHKKNEHFNTPILELVKGLRNQQFNQVKTAGPSRRPPVPVVLNPIPNQITPIGTIPLRYRDNSKYSHDASY